MSRHWNADSDDSGRSGITKTVGLLHAVCDSKGLHHKVKHWIASCVVCSQSKYGRSLTKAISTTKAWVPLLWGVVGADLCGSIKVSTWKKY